MAGGTDSPAGGDKQGRARRSQNIIPATVKQLQECGDTFTVEGFEANVVTIVGVVRKVESTTTKMSMWIDDQTGTMECINYVGTEGDSNSEPTMLSEGTYGRIVGALRSMKGSKYLIIFKAFPVTDLNEITMHLLEVIQNGQKLLKLRTAEEAKAAGGGATTGGMSNTFSNSMIATNLGGPTGNGTGGGSTNGGGGGLPGFTSNQNLVHGIISSARGEEGIHREDVIKQIKGRIPMKELLDILEFLSNEGHVFSTVDDDHYSATDSQYTS